MQWWILELVYVGVVVAAVAVMGPLIKRFGRAYAADVFRANPRTGKSYLVLMDIAYYLVFGAYVLFTIKWEPDTGWSDEVGAAQLQATVVRIGGLLLLMGLLHGLNVLSLPLVGRVFTLNRQLDDDVDDGVLRRRSNGRIDGERVDAGGRPQPQDAGAERADWRRPDE